MCVRPRWAQKTNVGGPIQDPAPGPPVYPDRKQIERIGIAGRGCLRARGQHEGIARGAPDSEAGAGPAVTGLGKIASPMVRAVLGQGRRSASGSVDQS
ncbi:MAG: hypothetical protein JWO65_1462 [Sphingomonas bacterium]|nr:hypothetical protein [Sphingomonas bacterium]